MRQGRSMDGIRQFKAFKGRIVCKISRKGRKELRSQGGKQVKGALQAKTKRVIDITTIL